MENAGSLLLLITSITSIASVAACVAAFWTSGSRSTRRRNSPQPPPLMEPSRADFVKLQDEVTSLSLSLGNLQRQLKKLRGYEAVEGYRDREANKAPPLGTPKAQLRLHYGLAGKTPAEVAEMARGADRNMQQE